MRPCEASSFYLSAGASPSATAPRMILAAINAAIRFASNDRQKRSSERVLTMLAPASSLFSRAGIAFSKSWPSKHEKCSLFFDALRKLVVLLEVRELCGILLGVENDSVQNEILTR
jgi:hypothetical protein